MITVARIGVAYVKATRWLEKTRIEVTPSGLKFA
jgi:hypothetical protein